MLQSGMFQTSQLQQIPTHHTHHPLLPSALIQPLLHPIINLINTFLDLKIQSPDTTDPVFLVPGETSLQLRLPRVGFLNLTTPLCHLAAHYRDAVVITLSHSDVDEFKSDHRKIFEKSSDQYKTPRIWSIFTFNHLEDRVNWLDPQISLIHEISNSLKFSNYIFFDNFSAYSDNRGVRNILTTCSATHKFVML